MVKKEAVPKKEENKNNKLFFWMVQYHVMVCHTPWQIFIENTFYGKLFWSNSNYTENHPII